MNANPIFVGDVGTVFTVEVEEDGAPADLSAATLKQILFRSPSGAGFTGTASFTSANGLDGVLTYTTVANNLNVAGEWELQAHIITPMGNWHSSIRKFEVHANLA